MYAHHIAGPSGSGKSTVGKVLERRGFRVIETDSEDGLSGWYSNVTGEKVNETPMQPYPKEWVDAHRWLWDKSKMDELLSSVGNEPIFSVVVRLTKESFMARLKNDSVFASIMTLWLHVYNRGNQNAGLMFLLS